MKVKRLKLNNFAKFTDFKVEFDGKITHLIGINGSGKTTLGLTAIWACLKGIAEKSRNGQLIGERYRFIGENQETADLELVLFDEQQNIEITIKNKISKDANKITFDAPIGYKLTNEWINNLLSVAFLSAKQFTSYSSKEQALLLGIDTSEFDKKIEKLKEEYTYINRKIRDLGKIKFVEKVEPVEVSTLIEERERIEGFNRIQRENTETVCKLKKRIEDLRNQIKEANVLLEKIPAIENLQETNYISEKIKNSEEINKKAIDYQHYLNKKSQYDSAKIEFDKIKSNIEEIKQEKINYIKGFDFGFKELSINGKGELLLNERPIKEQYFSKGELELIVAKLHVKVNPGLKLRFIDDFETLDEQNQERIIQSLLDNNFQIITAQVSNNNNQTDNNTIILQECKKVENQ